MARRRGVGVGAVKRREKQNHAFDNLGQQVSQDNLQHVQARPSRSFKDSLEVFARKYRKDIKQDPAFRHQFQTMCAKIGVDPLASNKGFWGELLGVGDFYYELAVQIAEVCLQTRAANGGLMSTTELLQKLQAKRSRHRQSVDLDDVKRAVSKLKVLGGGFGLLQLGATSMVVSVPRELNADHSALLRLVEGEVKHPFR
ncbi:unnamed protein product [Chrysoparadoxa australica]